MKLASSHGCCSLHPQAGRVVGICAPCLRERLTCLIESLSPADAVTGDEEEMQTGVHGHSHVHGDLLRREDPLQKVKHAHHVGHGSPYQGVKKVVPCTASPLIPSIGTNEKHFGSSRKSAASERGNMVEDLVPAPGYKKRSSWFSMSKGSKINSSFLNSPLPGGKSPPILAGRKSASDAIGQYNCNSYRLSQYMAAPELEAISEINLGEAAIQVDIAGGGNIISDVHASNSSWISSLFHRRRGSTRTSKSDVGPNTGILDEKAVAAHAFKLKNGSIKQSFVDAPGRLSLDIARSNFKLQFLKKEAARSKQQQQRVNVCSPMHIADCSRLQNDHDNIEDNISEQQLAHESLQTCKSVAAARRSSNLGPASPSLIFHSANANIAEMEYIGSIAGDLDMDFPRSQSSGRAWSRTLMSPLLGFKNYGRRAAGVIDPAAHQQQYPAGFASPNHIANSTKNSIGTRVPPSASSYLSPLYTRSKLGPSDHAHSRQFA